MQAHRFASEQHPAFNVLGLEGAHLVRRPARGEDILGHVAGAGRGGVQMAQIRHSVACGVEQLGLFQHHVSPRRGLESIGIWPALTRRHQTQIGQAAIQHGTRDHANVFPQLGLHQDYGGAALVGLGGFFLGRATETC